MLLRERGCLLADPEDANGNDNGTKAARMTVELVGAKLDEVKAIVAGHAEATNLKLDAIKDRIAPLSDIPERMTKVEGRVDRVEEKARDAQARRLQMPTIVFAGVGALGVILTIITQFH